MRSYLLAVLFAFLSPVFASESKPNILLIFADDIGYEALGCYGGLDFKTPHLNQMATEGLKFSRAHTNPVCTPSRVSLHTGRSTRDHKHTGVLPVHLGTKRKVDFEKMPTFAQSLRENGYATSVTGKWQLATLEHWPHHVRDAGFDSWCIWQIWRQGKKTGRHWDATYNHDGNIRDDIVDQFGPDVLIDYVVEEMTKAKEAEQPFFILHNELLPHYPMVETPLDRKMSRKANLGHMIEYMDHLVGKLLDAVEMLGIRDNTYVIFMGDNGTEESYFQNPSAEQPDEKQHTRHTAAGKVNGGKNQLNDAGSHVPFLVWGPPSVPAGTTCDDLVDIVDLFPTMCEVSGTDVEPSSLRRGHSLAAQFRGNPGHERSFTLQGLSKGEAIFDGSWRLILKSGKLIDARDLPREISVTAETPETTAIRERLKDYLSPESR